MSSKNRTVVLLLLVTAASNPGASLGDDDRVVQLVRGAGRRLEFGKLECLTKSPFTAD